MWPLFSKSLNNAEPQFTDDITYLIGMWESREIISKVHNTGTDGNKHLKIVCSMISIIMTSPSTADRPCSQTGFHFPGKFPGHLTPFSSSANEKWDLHWIAYWAIVRNNKKCGINSILQTRIWYENVRKHHYYFLHLHSFKLLSCITEKLKVGVKMKLPALKT